MKTLKDAKPGEVVRVGKLLGEGALKRRIMDMMVGLRPQTPANHNFD